MTERRRLGRACLPDGVWLVGLAALAAAGTACGGGGDTETSVFLQIFDSTAVATATDINIDVFGPGAGAAKIASLLRSAPASGAASGPLGSLVILPGGNASLGALHIAAQRLSGATLVSQGSLDVTLQARRQVGANLTLLGRGAGLDGGGGGDAGDIDAGRPDGGGADGSTPTNDGGDAAAALLANGEACRTGGACLSGFCADGVCCDGGCTALCHACNLPNAKGTCTVFSAGSQCVPGSCATSDSEAPARTCDATGNCLPASAPVSCGKYQCQNAACLRSCTSSLSCVSPARCSFNRCQ
jgi:hypothetical protein